MSQRASTAISPPPPPLEPALVWAEGGVKVSKAMLCGSHFSVLVWGFDFKPSDRTELD